jgi:hypothetical protein
VYVVRSAPHTIRCCGCARVARALRLSAPEDLRAGKESVTVFAEFIGNTTTMAQQQNIHSRNERWNFTFITRDCA